MNLFIATWDTLIGSSAPSMTLPGVTPANGIIDPDGGAFIIDPDGGTYLIDPGA